MISARGIIVNESKEAAAQAPKHESVNLSNAEMRQRLDALSLTLESVHQWNFDVLALDKARQVGFGSWILLQNASTLNAVHLKNEVVAKFFSTLSQNYRDNVFHAWAHAVDVQFTVWQMLYLVEAETFVTGLEQFGILVSAVSHDTGHLGLNNQFLIETAHELAMRYNDRSPLENLHCSRMFGIASGESGANIFEGLRRDDFFQLRQMCIEAILHTDMVHHFDMIKDTQMLYQMNVDNLEDDADPSHPMRGDIFADKDTKQKVLNLILHMADVSNPCKTWHLCQVWAMRCLEEFFIQGDQESRLGIPVQMLNDRNKVNKPLSQIGFIEFMILPLEAAKVQLFPGTYVATENLLFNLQRWSEIWEAEVNPPDEERDKVRARIAKSSERLTEAMPKEAVKKKHTNVGGPETSWQEHRVSVTSRVSSAGQP